MGGICVCCAQVDGDEKSQKVQGQGGALKILGGKVRVCVVAYDYKGYGAWKHSIPTLTCSRDGRRFATLAKDSGAEVREFYDSKELKKKSLGFPTKEKIMEEWRRVGSEMTDDDVFVFFFAGHGLRRKSEGGDEAKDDVMLFMTPDGDPVGLVDDEVAKVLSEAFSPQAHILCITDCCHCGTVCDLSRKELTGRPIIHFAAVRDSQSAQDLGDGGAFTCALLETIESLATQSPAGGARDSAAGKEEEEGRDLSVTSVFNKCYDTYSSRFSRQDFTFEQCADYDPDTFRWPLMPPAGWVVHDPLDGGCTTC